MWQRFLIWYSSNFWNLFWPACSIWIWPICFTNWIFFLIDWIMMGYFDPSTWMELKWSSCPIGNSYATVMLSLLCFYSLANPVGFFIPISCSLFTNFTVVFLIRNVNDWGKISVIWVQRQTDWCFHFPMPLAFSSPFIKH